MYSKAAAALLTLTLATPSLATTVLSINTQPILSTKTPHNGQVALGAVGKAPSEKYTQLEANAIALHITYNDADIVGLIGIEGENAAKKILNYLPKEYKLIFKKGRDNFTAQDVAIITRYQIIGEANDFSGIEGNYKTTKSIPSKALAITLKDESDIYNIIVAHLITKRANNDNHDKRAAQANAIVNYMGDKQGHNIVMGFLNDVPGSTTLNTFVDAGLNIIDANEYSFITDGKKQLLDHILVSDSLKEDATFTSFGLGAISDHRAVIAELDD